MFHIVYSPFRPIGLKVSHSEGELREKEKAPLSCLNPWTCVWRLGWYSTFSLWHTDNASYLVIFTFSDLENQSYLDWNTSCPTFKYVIWLHLLAGFCVFWKNPASKFPGWSLEGRAMYSMSLWIVTIQASSPQLVHQVWPIDTWRFWHTGHSFFLTSVDLATRAHAGARIPALVSFCLSLASLYLLWPQTHGLPANPIE